MRHTIHVGLIALATALVFSNTLHNSFQLDDYYRVVDNPGIQSVAPVWRHFTDPRTMSTLDRITQYRPLLPLTLSINYALGGYDPVGYHLVNLFIQIVASVLVYFLVLELLEHWSGFAAAESHRSRLALFVSLLFAVNPVSGILVNYVSSRDLLLMQAFLLASFLAYLRMRRKGISAFRWTGVLGLLALSLLSKTNSAVAPLLILAFELTAGRESPRSAALWRRALPFAVVVAGYLLFTNFVLGFSDLAHVKDPATSPWQYALTQARLHLFHYLAHFIWPFPIRQSPLIERSVSLAEPAVLLGLVFIAVSVVLAWWLRRRAPVISFSILAYWVLMIPESSVLPLYHLAADYRPYPSSPFLFLAVGMALERRAPDLTPLLLVFAAYLGFTSLLLNRTWRTGETLWTHSVRHGGDALAHMNLAMSLRDRTDPRVRENLEEALRLSPNFVLAHINLGLLLIDLGQAPAGLEHVRTAVRLAPRWAQTHYWLAHAYARLGRKQDAAQASGIAADLDQHNLGYQYQAAMDAYRMGDYAAVLRRVAAVERINPDYEETQLLKGFALQMTGRLDEAIPTFQKFLGTHPDHAVAEFDLGHALMTSKRCDEAVPHFEKVLALKPDYAAAHLHLSTCYKELGNGTAAAEHAAAYEASRAPR
jgi:Flp pilus assembly protein TadD